MLPLSTSLSWSPEILSAPTSSQILSPLHDVCSSVNGDPSPVTAAANSSLNLLRETDCSCGDAVEVVELPVVVKPPPLPLLR